MAGTPRPRWWLKITEFARTAGAIFNQMLGREPEAPRSNRNSASAQQPRSRPPVGRTENRQHTFDLINSGVSSEIKPMGPGDVATAMRMASDYLATHPRPQTPANERVDWARRNESVPQTAGRRARKVEPEPPMPARTAQPSPTRERPLSTAERLRLTSGEKQLANLILEDPALRPFVDEYVNALNAKYQTNARNPVTTDLQSTTGFANLVSEEALHAIAGKLEDADKYKTAATFDGDHRRHFAGYALATAGIQAMETDSKNPPTSLARGSAYEFLKDIHQGFSHGEHVALARIWDNMPNDKGL